VRTYERVPGCAEPDKLLGYMKVRPECVGPRAGKDKLCILYNEMMSIYPRVSQIYTPCCSVHYDHLSISVCLFAQSVSIVPVSPYAPCRLPPAKQNGSGGGKLIFQPQLALRSSLSSLNWCLQVLLQLHLSTVCSQIDRMQPD